jgi:hypothetical protein
MQIANKRIQIVTAIRRPRGFAVPAQIDTYSAAARLGQGAGHTLPRAARLPAAGQNQHNRIILGAIAVGLDLQAAKTCKAHPFHDESFDIF